MASKNLRALAVALFDTGIAMLVFEGTKGYIGNIPAAAVMLLVIGVLMFVQGSAEYEDKTPEEKVLGGSDE